MKEDVHYETVSTAINQLKSQGFTTDFNLEDNCLVCNLGKFAADEFEIVDVYRYEGDSDPGDEAAVYAIESKGGIKGILVTGYGASEDSFSSAILRKLQMHHK